MVLVHTFGTGNNGPYLRVGDGTIDTGTNYTDRFSINGGVDADTPNSDNIDFFPVTNAHDKWVVICIDNNPTGEKLIIGHTTDRNTLGAGTAPNRMETVGKWVETGQIDSIRIQNPSTGDFDAGSQVVVLGWDPSDTHDDTQSFWQFLGSATASGGETNLDVIFSAKKYLWFQAVGPQQAGGGAFHVRTGIGSFDSANNYSTRVAFDGGVDSLSAPTNLWPMDTSSFVENIYIDYFIVNVDGKEKLAITDSVTHVPSVSPFLFRSEGGVKYVTTTGVLDRLRIIRLSGSGSFVAGAKIIVWGSD